MVQSTNTKTSVAYSFHAKILDENFMNEWKFASNDMIVLLILIL